MRFAYYRRLSGEDKAIYRASDEYGSIELEDPPALRLVAEAVRDALRGDDRLAVEKLTQRVVTGICRQMGVSSPGVRVMAVRPRSASSELYGLYVRAPERRPVLMVWMRTAARERAVAHRTYLRTVFHEACHHLDYELLDLDDSFHTHGFFQRESSLMRQILPKPRASDPKPDEPARVAAQLRLPL